MKPLNNQELNLLISLVKAEKETINFLSGFATPTKEQQDRAAKFNELISKLEDFESFNY